MIKLALVDVNKVANVIILEDESFVDDAKTGHPFYSHYIVLEEESEVSVGWDYDGLTFSRPDVEAE